MGTEKTNVGAGESSPAPDGSAYSIDDRGNVVDCYGRMADGTWERVARLDREAGPPPCNQLAWDNETGDPGIEDWLRANGYADELTEAMQNSVLGQSQEATP